MRLRPPPRETQDEEAHRALGYASPSVEIDGWSMSRMRVQGSASGCRRPAALARLIGPRSRAGWPRALNTLGSIAREKARICALTFACSQDDPHPTDAGYRAIAAVVWAASGYKHRS
jgi:hypothetical protein